MTPWTVAHQAPLSVGFPRQGYWSALLFPPLGNLPDPGAEPMSVGLARGLFFIIEDFTKDFIPLTIHVPKCGTGDYQRSTRSRSENKL